MEPHTRANQVLPQIAALISFDLAARIIEVVVFNEGAELRSPIVIRAGNDLPRQVCVTLTSAGAEATAGGADVDTRGFRVVNADPGAGIRLEPPTLGRDSQNEVKHKGASVNSAIHAAAAYYIPIGFSQGEVSAALKPVVKEIAFNGRTKYTPAKDVTEFDAAEKTDVIFWVHFETVSEKR